MSKPRKSCRRTRRTAGLTDQENRIAGLVARGLKNKEIAATLSVPVEDVKAHLLRLFEKMGVMDRFELALTLLRAARP